MFTKLILALFLSTVLIQASDLGTRKSEELRAKVLGHSSIPKLSAAEYKRFLEESPRPYDVVVFFTAPHCEMCDEVEAELGKVANLYNNSGALYPVNDENKKQRAVYFVKVSFEPATKEIFVGLQLTSVPNILVSTPNILRLRDNEKAEHYRNFMWQISQSDGTLTSKKLLQYINKKTGRNVEYKESILKLFTVLIVLSGFLAAGVSAFLRFRPFFLSPVLWMIGSMLVYFVCMSGCVYNMTRDVPLSLFNTEGYIMSGATSFLGVLLIVLLQLPKFTGSASGKMIYLGLFLSIFLLIRWVEGVYYLKSGFSNPVFFPPDHYIRGPLSKDQGNDI